MGKRMWFRGAAVIVLGAALSGGCAGNKGAGAKSYEFTRISRGAIEKTVSSSGSLNPVATAKVLPRMSGKVEKIHVDYNDQVRRGDVIAELNTDMLRLQREQQLAQVIKSRANYELQLINYRNQEALAAKNLISEYELKTGKTNLDIQAAELSAAEANLKVIETEINQYAFITSPIDGIVLERNINEGDTVVDSSSSNSTSIFTLAENLEEMQIESWVGELDIASIYEGQEARFTLESLPGRVFAGTVESKRLMPSVQDNVVSYKVIISVRNRDGILLPGMTCAVEFIEERKEDILLVPNAALRYQPTGMSAGEISDLVFAASLEGMDEDRRNALTEARNSAREEGAGPSGGTAGPGGGGGLTGLLGGNMGRGMGPPGPPGGRQGGGRLQTASNPARESAAVPPRPLWIVGGNGKPEAVLVQAGTSDGSNTEITPLREGT
ncbi:MAG: efflux RND transporter periplasmic adaptor subunit, partial [Treponema sp.]|nr:efflux RND transporter periplasmic adaptor subunit [Treponema sp.]